MGLEQAWYRRSSWLKLLRPVELLFRFLSARRRQSYASGQKQSWTAPVPVIVVGNISVGGTGKSPLVVWLVEYLRAKGLKPGVISRGYGANPPCTPYFVTSGSSASEAGDEPLMIVRRTGVPMVIAPDRVAAAKLLLEQTSCDLIISDDGLQHYALNRSIEIVVVDGSRGFANGRCLPEGPLREPVERLDEVDLIVVNGTAAPGLFSENQSKECGAKQFSMQLTSDFFVHVKRASHCPVDQWTQRRQVDAIAGIGNPQRFADTLTGLGFTPQLHRFPDHYRYKQEDLDFGEDSVLIMTEKDAVKCDHITLNNAWYLQVSARLDESFSSRLDSLLKQTVSFGK